MEKVSWRLVVGGRHSTCQRSDYFRGLLFVEFVEAFPPRHSFGAIETLAALAAAIGAIWKEEQDPKFQKAPALGAMHVVAAAKRTISIFGVWKQSKDAFHWQRIIAPCESGRNRQAQLTNQSSTSPVYSEASTCSA